MAISSLPIAQPAPAPAPQKHKYDPNFTEQVVAATGPNANARLAQIMPSLLRHLHDFAREVDLTIEEWMIGVEFINACGQMSTSSRNETQLLCNVLGLESLVDEITSTLLSSPGSSATPSAVLGPFYRSNAPILANGASIVAVDPSSPWFEAAQRDGTFVSGRVFSAAETSAAVGRADASDCASSSSDGGSSNGDDAETGPVPLCDAVVDVWHTAPNGLYEQQDAGQPDMNLRGRFRTDAQGRFAFYCLRPVSYPIPYDGPAGRLLQALDRHPNRPAHIHFIVTADGHRSLTTQVFDRTDPYLGDDAVFAVKDDLVVDFVPRQGDDRAKWSLNFDFVLGRAV